MEKSTLTNLRKRYGAAKWLPVFLGLFLLLGLNSFAQVTVTLGSSTTVSTNSSTGSGLGPVNGYYEYMRFQVVYTASEINAAGGAGGTISQFGWNVSNLPNAGTLPNYKVRMANTTATNSASHNAAALTEVYNADFTPVLGYNLLTLSTPFEWDGTSNLLVDVCFGSVTYSSPFGQVYTYGTASNSSRFARSDDSSRCESNTNYTNAWKPQAQFVVTPFPACSGTPVAGTPTGNLVNYLCAGSTPAAISVTGANAAAPGISYQWEESLNGTDWANATGGSGATTTTYAPPAFSGTPIQYRLKVTCTNSAEFATSPSVSITNVIAPSTQVTALTSTSTLTTAPLSWTNGNGGRRLVIFSSAPITDPVSEDGIPAYTAAALYANAGQQIVYDGTGTSVTVTGLACNTTYYVKVYEYNRCGSGPYSVYINTTTDTNVSTVTTGQPATAVLPVTNSFTGFTGTNLTTAVPGWYEGNIPTTGGSTPSSTAPVSANSAWRSSTAFGVTTAVVNLYTNTRNEWIISPAMEITADSWLVFDAAITNYSSSAADNSGGMQGTDDFVNVMVSTDGCGAVWTPVYTFNAANTTTLTNALTEYQVLLTDYIGQTIQIAFRAADGPVDDGPDYDFHIGNIVIEGVPECEAPVLQETSAITKNSATISWDAPIVGTPTAYEYVVSETNTTPTVADDTTTELSVDIALLTPSTDYYVFVRTICGTDGNSEWTSAGEFTTLCDYPELLTVSPDATVCGDEITTLSATSDGGTVKWYANATGGPALASGEDFDTPVLSETTTYYVAAESVGTTLAGGKLAPESTWTGTSLSNWGIVFNVLQDVTINSVDVYSTSAGTLNVKIVNSSGTELYATGDIAVAAGGVTTPTVIPLDFAITMGTGYKILVKSYSGVNLIRGGTNLNFPYVNNNISVTSSEWGGTTTSTYYYFYNIQTTAPCAGARTPVTVNVTDAPEITVSDAVEVCPGEDAEISVSSDNADYTYNWMPGNLDGAAQTVNPEETTTYTVTATDAVSGCVITGTVTVTVNPLPSPVVISPSPVTGCPGVVQSLEVTGGTIGGEATVGDGTSLTGTTEELTVFCNRRDTHNSQTIYSAADLNASGLVAGSIVSIAYNVNSIGSSADNSDFTVKIGTTSLESFPNTSYIDESGFVTVFAPADYTHVIGVNTITFTTPFEWDGVSNIVVSISQSGADSLYNAQTYYTTMGANVTLYNYDNLAAATGTASTKRFNATFNVEAQTETTWSPVTNLYTDADATIAYTEDTNATVVYFKSDVAVTETYTVTSTSSAGCSVSSTVDVTVDVVAAPTVDNADVTLCDGATVAELMATGDNIQWYAAATGGEPLAGDVALADGTYYASQTVDGCESMTRTALNVTVYIMETPAVTVVHPGCGETTGSITFTVPLGDSFVYSIDGGINFQASPAFLGLVPGDYTPIVRNSDNDCQVTLETETINPVPPVPSVASVTVVQPFCEVTTGTITITDPIGDEFDYSINGIDFQDSPIFADLEPDTYVVTVMNASGCTSVTADIVINPAAVVNAPTVDNTEVTICNAGTVAELMANGDNIQWYTDETGGTALAGDAVLANGTYYASQTIDGCESATRTAVTVTVNVVIAPTTDALVTICNAGTVADLTANGQNIQWYAEQTGGTALTADTALVEGTYYASQTIDGCESASREATSVTINVVAAPTGEANQTVTVENPADATIEDIEVTVEDGAVVTWYASEEDAIAGDNPIAAGTQLTDGTTYYATQTVDGCESDVTLAVTVGVVLGRDDFNIKAFSYYPNPVQDVLNISYDKEITSVAVFNLLGQQVMAKTPNATEVKLDMSVLSDGTYLVSVTAGNTVKTIKVVKKQ